MSACRVHLKAAVLLSGGSPAWSYPRHEDTANLKALMICKGTASTTLGKAPKGFEMTSINTCQYLKV